jgi:hypothetical protein
MVYKIIDMESLFETNQKYYWKCVKCLEFVDEEWFGHPLFNLTGLCREHYFKNWQIGIELEKIKTYGRK